MCVFVLFNICINIFLYKIKIMRAIDKTYSINANIGLNFK